MHKNFAKAFAFIEAQDLQAIEVGKYPIDGDDLHASVSSRSGVKAADAKFEAHDRHIDIQLCISGTEQIGWKPRSTCIDPKEAYNAEKDVIFYNDPPDMYFRLREGQFVILFPEDVHAPMIGEEVIKKMVVKVKI